MPRAGLGTEAVVDLALELVDAGEPVSLGAVADRAGVRTPSLYKHVGSLAELRSRVAERALTEYGDAVVAAIGDARGPDAAAAALRGIRAYALAHPHRYATIPAQPLDDPRLVPTARELLRRLGAALDDDPGSPAAIHAMRLLRAAADGWVRIETAGGFGEPVDVEASWEVLVATVSRVAAPTVNKT